MRPVSPSRNNQDSRSGRPRRGARRPAPLLALLAVLALSAHADPAAAAAPPLPTSACPVSVVGHRGTDAGGVRNNTIAAFVRAAADGADVLELDIHRTRADSSGRGTWVVNHDATIEGRAIARTSYATLKRLRPDLATFRQAVRYAATAHLPMQVEVKPSRVGTGSLRYFAATADDLGMVGRFELDSAHPKVLTAFRSLRTPFATGYILRSYASPAAVTKVADTALLSSRITTRAWARALRRAGVAVEVWTVDASADWSRYVGYPVDAIITDRSGALVAWCRQRD